MTLDPMDYVSTAPSYLMLVGGIIYLWTVRRRSPRAAGMAIGGLTALIVWKVVRERSEVALYHYCMTQDGLFGLSGFDVFRMGNALANLVQACCWLLVIGAVMTDRRRAELPGGRFGS